MEMWEGGGKDEGRTVSTLIGNIENSTNWHRRSINVIVAKPSVQNDDDSSLTSPTNSFLSSLPGLSSASPLTSHYKEGIEIGSIFAYNLGYTQLESTSKVSSAKKKRRNKKKKKKKGKKADGEDDTINESNDQITDGEESDEADEQSTPIASPAAKNEKVKA